MKTPKFYQNTQDKMRLFNLLSQTLNAPTHTSRQILRLLEQYKKAGGSIDDFKKQKSKIEQYLAQSRPDSHKIEQLTARKWLLIEKRCQEKGLDFNLKLSDVKRLLSRKTCAYSGEPIFLYEDGHENPDDLLTIERIDSKKGYVRGNVVAVSNVYNQMKSYLFEKRVDELNALSYSDINRVIKALEGMKKYLGAKQ